MAHLVPLRHWPRCAPHCSRVLHVLASFFNNRTRIHFSLPSAEGQVLTISRSLFGSASPRGMATFRAQGLRLQEAADLQEDGDSENTPTKKSRNEKKREARLAVRWGMELAELSIPQIKRVIRVACLEREVFDALMLVKRLGPDVREGKRRQFNYIGRLLRNVQPELMDALIQASKDGDSSRLIGLTGQETWDDGDEGDEKGVEEIEYEEEVTTGYIETANRWFEGLVDKNTSITNEVYSVQNVEFDRQELRKLVRRVHSIQENQLDEDKAAEVDAALSSAKKSLHHFLRALARQTVAD